MNNNLIHINKLLIVPVVPAIAAAMFLVATFFQCQLFILFQYLHNQNKEEIVNPTIQNAINHLITGEAIQGNASNIGSKIIK